VITGNLSGVATTLRGELVGEDRAFLGVSTDTRTLESGQLFFALIGPRFDGHRFLGAAAGRAAAGAVVSRECSDALPCIRVPDTLRGLGELATDWRGRFDIPVVGVTGSAGKTTVKEMTAAILAESRATLVTRGNLNNEIGVPLTLFGLAARHRAAVIEMGANHAGEIARLGAMAKPSIGVVTLAGAAHLAGFGSVEGVARAKGELFTALPEDGIAIINVDDCYAGLWRRMAGSRRVLGFGLGPGADYSARDLRMEVKGAAQIEFRLVCPLGEAPVSIPVAGRHNVVNALAAAAAAAAAGASLSDIAIGLAKTPTVQGRMQLTRGVAGSRIIDDTYNANPGSMRAALDFLSGLEGLAWAVIGDMGELGDQAARMHAEIGEYARSVGVEKLFGVGELAGEAVARFGPGGKTYPDVDSLVRDLRPMLHADVNLLVKGSRSAGMERVVAALADAPTPGAVEGTR
jgi:UDP-N-acetylmuramoyl-tripeptide--D-alanyl-D-alanine ligase